MRKTILSLLFTIFILVNAAYSQNSKYDEALANKLGADEYGMKNYMFVILKSGDNKTADKAYKDSCFAGHLKNIGRMVESNQLIVAGPFGKNSHDFRGLFILNVKTEAEANDLLLTDPAIKAGFLSPILIPWYGSAALSEYLDEAERIQKSSLGN